MRRKKTILAALLAAVLAVLTACGPQIYEPAGEPTGVESLDAAVLTLLQELCDPKAGLEENLGIVYDWVRDEIAYRAGAEDTSGGFTDELTAALAEAMLSKRRGNCDGEAALMAVLLRRMGCESVVVQGTFTREDGQEVDHAWVIAQVGEVCRHFDPLYERYYTENADRSCFLGTDADFLTTHSWQQADYPACAE